MGKNSCNDHYVVDLLFADAKDIRTLLIDLLTEIALGT